MKDFSGRELEMSKPLPATRCGNTEFRWGERTYIMGVCNLSPDSFSCDGLGDDIEATLAQARRFVDEGADTGPIIIQKVVPIKEKDTIDSLKKKVQREEGKAIVEGVRLFQQGKLKVKGRRVLIK